MGSKNGSAPLIAYDLTSKRKRKWIVFMTERSFAHSSAIIKFATTVGLCKDPNELSDIAFSVPDTDGVHFLANIPSMAGFIGVKSSTKSSHLVRAILESIIFNIALLFFLTKEESSDKFDRVRIDGGISQNDFVCQTIADLINVKIERGVNASEITSVGVAYFSAFLSNEVLEELEQAEHKYKVDRVFWPIDANRKKLFMRFKKFENLLQKFRRVEE
jgi:glycerol kinase